MLRRLDSTRQDALECYQMSSFVGLTTTLGECLSYEDSVISSPFAFPSGIFRRAHFLS